MMTLLRRSLLLSIALSASITASCFAFVVPSPALVAIPAATATTTTTSLHQSGLSSSSTAVEFEYQELSAQLDAMHQQGIASRNLNVLKRAEITSYVRKVADRRLSLPLTTIGELLPSTTWRLAFSTEGATMGDLPPDATVVLDFIDESNLDYSLQFTKKTLGLRNIKAKSKWVFSQETGVLSFVYDQVTSGLFGWDNLNVDFLGLLKGRTNFVESAFFDGRFWIERGLDLKGDEFWNVYVREDKK